MDERYVGMIDQLPSCPPLIPMFKPVPKRRVTEQDLRAKQKRTDKRRAKKGYR